MEKVEGRVTAIRKTKSIIFIDLYLSVKAKIEIVIDKLKCKNNIDELESITTNSFVVFNCKEIGPNKFEFISIIKILHSSQDYPLQQKKQSFEFLRKYPELRSRTKCFQAINKIRNTVFRKLTYYLQMSEFTQIQCPILTTLDTEGAGNTFKLYDGKKYFKEEVRLSVTSQLYLEASVQNFGNVFSFQPIFRAEKSNTSTHLSEFWMLEVEMLDTTITELEVFIYNLLRPVIFLVTAHCKDEIDYLQELNNKYSFLRVETPKETLTYTKAIEIINDELNLNVEIGHIITKEQEKFLCDKYKGLVSIINYPEHQKAFYMKSENGLTESIDLFMNGIEIVGGSVRENDIDKLKSKLLSKTPSNEEQNILKKYEWYINLRKYGYINSSGFGLGFDRLLQVITGVENIRDMVLYPRTYKEIKH